MAEAYLKKAEREHMGLLFEWANDKAVRQNSFNTKRIDYESHQKWFSEKINSKESVIYIYCYNEIPMGQVRVDIKKDNGLISYSVDSKYRSQGHGGMILLLLEATIKESFSRVKYLCAKVKKTNIASQKRFEQFSYEKKERTEFIEYRKKIEYKVVF